MLGKPANLFSWLNHGMAPLTLKERLEEVMQAKSWAYADLVRESGESRSVVSQWLGRSSKIIKSIGKMQAAERLEVASGFRALWIAKGAGPKHVVASPTALAVPAPSEVTLAQALEVLGIELARELPDDVRQDVAHTLAKLAERKGLARHQSEVITLLAEPWKRQANG